ncbi:hypothetical protein CLU79DRAFT_707761 [Phycomyces nitens]|nr:hypothetical protein CLU79DRAFT_707761 [Phycomyces nitens]
MSLSPLTDIQGVSDALAKFNLSYTDVGIHMEANVTNVSDLRSLIDAFSQLCIPTIDRSQDSKTKTPKPSHEHKTVVYRNKSQKTKPANFFASVSLLGLSQDPHSTHKGTTLREMADACVDAYFSCWIRCASVLVKDEFMEWYTTQPSPEDTFIVNAICSFMFNHMLIHHPKPEFTQFIGDQDKIREQEEFYFDRARHVLAQIFDDPDRYMIVGLLMMSTRAEAGRRHHYVGMAVSMLHQLEIYPRMITDPVDIDDDRAFDKEMDTRLWWFAWSIDFYLYSAGAPKNTPQPRLPGQVSLPRVFEQDIDGVENSILAHEKCIPLWQMQAEIILAVYEKDADMTVEQLDNHDAQLNSYYNSLPLYLQCDSGFEYGNEDLFLACLRVNVEYNATRILLHKLFLPEVTDPRPSRLSLQSLNTCLITSLTQLRVLNTCTRSALTQCAFDRDELWRASEVISMAMDIYRTCISPEDQRLILQNIDRTEYENGLNKALEILKKTREYDAMNKNWIQVADWLQVEIKRHKLYSRTSSPKESSTSTISQTATPPDYYLANLKINKPQDIAPRKRSRQMSSSESSSMLSVLSFPQPNFSSVFPSLLGQRKTACSNAPQVQFNMYIPEQQSPSPSPSPSSPQHKPRPQQLPQPFQQFNAMSPGAGKNQPRFRYFNPRKMNKFLFIDEHPM